MIAVIALLAVAQADTCGYPPPCAASLLGSDDAIHAAAPEFPVASAFLGSAASCLSVYQVNSDGSTRPDCITCDVSVDFDRMPGFGDVFVGVSRGEIEARIRRTVAQFVFDADQAGRWGRTYFDFILEGDDPADIPDRPERSRCPIPVITPAKP